MSRRRRVPRFTSTTSRATSPRWPAPSSRRERSLDTSPPEPRLSALYQELILDHYRRPRNKGALAGATHSVSLNNPLCGDEIDLQLRVADDVIRDVRFIGRGCSISQASASMMTQLLKDRTVPQALTLAARRRARSGASWSGAAARPGGGVSAERGALRRGAPAPCRRGGACTPGCGCSTSSCSSPR